MSEVTLIAGTAGWKLQPVAVRNTYPEFIQKVYFTAELFTSKVTDWELYLVTTNPLDAASHTAYIELSYQRSDELIARQFPLILISENAIAVQEAVLYRYKYKVHEQAQAFFADGMQLRLSKRAKTIRFNYIQPLFESNENLKGGQVEYALLPDYGLLSIGDFMRKLSFLEDDEWLTFCADPNYIYNKVSACGDVRINSSGVAGE
ncbi:hypothetical protein [Pseudoalteromonas holothuriae]|uniref:hypothetical protein n=1 Tax=Pseudoalteromonas holothuriae TaxID=2963714 RepID=UPI0021C16899|nr:hypothetical protein [Pseudoalteromonas sp. CIP111854]